MEVLAGSQNLNKQPSHTQYNQPVATHYFHPIQSAKCFKESKGGAEAKSPGARQVTQKNTRGKGEVVHFQIEDQFWPSLYMGPILGPLG